MEEFEKSLYKEINNNLLPYKFLDYKRLNNGIICFDKQYKIKEDMRELLNEITQDYCNFINKQFCEKWVELFDLEESNRFRICCSGGYYFSDLISLLSVGLKDTNFLPSCIIMRPRNIPYVIRDNCNNNSLVLKNYSNLFNFGSYQNIPLMATTSCPKDTLILLPFNPGYYSCSDLLIYKDELEETIIVRQDSFSFDFKNINNGAKAIILQKRV